MRSPTHARLYNRPARAGCSVIAPLLSWAHKNVHMLDATAEEIERMVPNAAIQMLMLHVIAPPAVESAEP